MPHRCENASSVRLVCRSGRRWAFSRRDGELKLLLGARAKALWLAVETKYALAAAGAQADDFAVVRPPQLRATHSPCVSMRFSEDSMPR
jgi:hypothetical protein